MLRIFVCRWWPHQTSLTRRQSQRRDLSRSMLSHGSRQFPSWLIFDVGLYPILLLKHAPQKSERSKAKAMRRSVLQSTPLPTTLEGSARSDRHILARTFWPASSDSSFQEGERLTPSHALSQTSEIFEPFFCLRSIPSNKTPEPTP